MGGVRSCIITFGYLKRKMTRYMSKFLPYGFLNRPMFVLRLGVIGDGQYFQIHLICKIIKRDVVKILSFAPFCQFCSSGTSYNDPVIDLSITTHES